MKEIGDFILRSLKERTANNSLRSLTLDRSKIDFCSNDYLGFSRSPELRKLFELELEKHSQYRLGATGSRLISGNDRLTQDLEAYIARFHKSETSLLFNSGYDANVGIFSCLPQRGDTIICDEYIHASIIDGVRLSHASRYTFKHNDLGSLEQKIKNANGRIFIAVESVYSMDGDEAPLKEICRLAEQYGAAVIVDEAHAIGVFGKNGRGIVNELDLESKIFARVVTFGKALGTHGAAILGNEHLKSYLINFARSFIYTTASPFLTHLSVEVAYQFLESADHQKTLHQKITNFRSAISDHTGIAASRSAIQVLLIPGNTRARDMALKLQQGGFDVRAILSPTVTKGSERLRICLHNHNSDKEIADLCDNINQLL